MTVRGLPPPHMSRASRGKSGARDPLRQPGPRLGGATQLLVDLVEGARSVMLLTLRELEADLRPVLRLVAAGGAGPDPRLLARVRLRSRKRRAASRGR